MDDIMIERLKIHLWAIHIRVIFWT